MRTLSGTATRSDQAVRTEWDDVRLRPVAHWVQIPTATGPQLRMVWEVPNPVPPGSPA